MNLLNHIICAIKTLTIKGWVVVRFFVRNLVPSLLVQYAYVSDGGCGGGCGK